MIIMKVCEWIYYFLEDDEEDWISFILTCGLLILSIPCVLIDLILFPLEFIIALIYFIKKERRE